MQRKTGCIGKREKTIIELYTWDKLFLARKPPTATQTAVGKAFKIGGGTYMVWTPSDTPLEKIPGQKIPSRVVEKWVRPQLVHSGEGKHASRDRWQARNTAKSKRSRNRGVGLRKKNTSLNKRNLVKKND